MHKIFWHESRAGGKKTKTKRKRAVGKTHPTWMTHDLLNVYESKHWKCRSSLPPGISRKAEANKKIPSFAYHMRAKINLGPTLITQHPINYLPRFPRNKKQSATHHPKSAGNDVNDMSFNPNIVRLLSCAKPAGSLVMGLELKSAIWSSRK